MALVKQNNIVSLLTHMLSPFPGMNPYLENSQIFDIFLFSSLCVFFSYFFLCEMQRTLRFVSPTYQKALFLAPRPNSRGVGGSSLTRC